MTLGLAMAACLGWGIADFIGGLKSRDIPTLSVLLVSNAVGACLLGLMLAGSGRSIAGGSSLIWAAPAGLMGFTAMYLLYRGLAIGTMAILAPVSATGVILPVVWGLIGGDDLPVLKMAGMAVAFLGTILAVMQPVAGKRQIAWTKGLPYALGAAVCTGLYFILMDSASDTDPLYASVIMRAFTLLFLISAVLIFRHPLLIRKAHLPLVALMGVVDTLAAFAFALAANSGMLSIVSVISSLYPAVTVMLSTVIIRERLNLVQSSGVVLAIIGVMLISGC